MWPREPSLSGQAGVHSFGIASCTKNINWGVEQFYPCKIGREPQAGSVAFVTHFHATLREVRGLRLGQGKWAAGIPWMGGRRGGGAFLPALLQAIVLQEKYL